MQCVSSSAGACVCLYALATLFWSVSARTARSRKSNKQSFRRTYRCIGIAIGPCLHCPPNATRVQHMPLCRRMPQHVQHAHHWDSLHNACALDAVCTWLQHHLHYQPTWRSSSLQCRPYVQLYSLISTSTSVAEIMSWAPANLHKSQASAFLAIFAFPASPAALDHEPLHSNMQSRMSRSASAHSR